MDIRSYKKYFFNCKNLLRNSICMCVWGGTGCRRWNRGDSMIWIQLKLVFRIDCIMKTTPFEIKNIASSTATAFSVSTHKALPSYTQLMKLSWVLSMCGKSLLSVLYYSEAVWCFQFETSWKNKTSYWDWQWYYLSYKLKP